MKTLCKLGRRGAELLWVVLLLYLQGQTPDIIGDVKRPLLTPNREL
jgi:hypothetical protein